MHFCFCAVSQKTLRSWLNSYSKFARIRRVKEMEEGVEYIGVGVVFFCHDGEGNFILSKRTKNTRDEHGRWDPGGGAIK